MLSIADELDVSRETSARLADYCLLVEKWNPKINLVSKSSVSDIWNRHIWDSAQVYPLAGDDLNWVDLGSGGGFPGLVVAILAKQYHPGRRVTLVESDIRKSAFLRTVIRELDLNATVSVDRIEDVESLSANILSARALTDLTGLLAFVDQHLTSDGRAFLFKGRSWEKEVEDARRAWSFWLQPHTSKSNPEAAILEIKELKRV